MMNMQKMVMKMLKQLKKLSLLLVCSAILAGCGQKEESHRIQPAQKPSSDATAYAQEAWVLINQLDRLLYSGETQHLNEMVEEPLRELNTRWRVEVKMTDSVVEGKYALCRKSLTSLSAWSRSISNHAGDIESKKKQYEHDKALCKDAIEHPSQGNVAHP